MKIATWNVNSVKLRLVNLLSWIDQSAPDIICLQELKCIDDAFPYFELEAAGYNIAVHGQKSFNGVALLSRYPLEDITRGLPNFEDEQSRYIEAVISHPRGALRVASIYLPNGNPIENGASAKFQYKHAWLGALETHLANLLRLEEAFVISGDYNIIPSERDAYNPETWRNDALFHPQSRAAYYRLLNMGLTDAVAALCHSNQDTFTFWDYQGGAWTKNHGIRIDHHLLSPQAADHLCGFNIMREMRSWEKPSDHVPVEITLDL